MLQFLISACLWHAGSTKDFASPETVQSIGGFPSLSSIHQSSHSDNHDDSDNDNDNTNDTDKLAQVTILLIVTLVIMIKKTRQQLHK